MLQSHDRGHGLSALPGKDWSSASLHPPEAENSDLTAGMAAPPSCDAHPPPQLPATPDFRVLFESIPGLYLVLTAEFHVVAVSNEYLRATLTQRERVLGRHLFDIFPDNPDDPAADGVRNLNASLQRVLQHRRPDAMPLQKYDVARPDGSGFQLKYWSPVNSPICDEAGRIRYIIHRVEDVTEFVQIRQSSSDARNLAEELRTRAEHMEAEIYARGRQLEQVNRQLASVLNDTAVSVYAIDRDWKICFLNENARQVLQVGSEVYGTEIWDAFPNAQPATRQRIEQVMATRQPCAFESFYAPLDLTSTVSVHPWEDGGITVFFIDISEQKRLQRDLDRERTARSQRVEVLARLAGELAHEIKNPLAIIHARASDLAELAAENAAIPVDIVAKTCASIVKTSDRAIRILRGLEALARDGRRDPMHRTEVHALVEQTVELVQRRFTTHGIELIADVPPGLPPLLCREVQIGQVLMNLLNNAFDAIDSSPESQRWVRVTASTQPSEPAHLVIDVIDGGPGVTEEAREHLMETFYTTKAVGAGMGVGLSVSRSIAVDHGGTLQLLEAAGHTCFRLSLPFGDSHASEAAA